MRAATDVPFRRKESVDYINECINDGNIAGFAAATGGRSWKCTTGLNLAPVVRIRKMISLAKTIPAGIGQRSPEEA